MDVNTSYIEALDHLGLAKVLFDRGDSLQAKNHLVIARHIGRNTKSRFLEYLCLLYKAQFSLDQKMNGDGLASLRKALVLGKRQGYITTSLWCSLDIARLCEKALEHDIEVAYVQNVIRTCNLVSENSPVQLDQWPWTVRVYTFGRFQLLRDGEPIRFTGKSQKKPLEMLRALISMGGREVSEEPLAEVLWPDSEGDAAHQAFKTTLHRLRKLLGYDEALQFHEGRLTLDSHYCWTDIWCFERLLGQIQQLKVGKKEIMRKIQLLERMIALYEGPYLGREAEQRWALPMRERLRSKFLRSITTLGRCYEQTHQIEKEIECYLKGLEVDHLAEELYQHLMRCYHKLGRQAEALAVYEKCCRTLLVVFGISPSDKTKAVYRMVRQRL